MTFREFLKEALNTGGQASGKLEMHRIKFPVALTYTNKVFDAAKIPKLEQNFNMAKHLVSLGHMKRSQMPVITSRDVDGFKESLKSNGVQMQMKKVKVKELEGIQSQVYFDKSMGGIAKNGIEKTKAFLNNKTFFITSSDHKIIDGHHRYLQALLIDPNMSVQILAIDLPIKELLKTSIAYGDSVGNKRNL